MCFCLFLTLFWFLFLFSQSFSCFQQSLRLGGLSHLLLFLNGWCPSWSIIFIQIWQLFSLCQTNCCCFHVPYFLLHTLCLFFMLLIPRGGGGVLLSKRLLGMCRWMGSHFRNWTDYNGVTFLVELLEWGRTFSGFLRLENSGMQGFKNRKIRG